MSSARSDRELLAFLRDVIQDSSGAVLGPSADQACLERLSLGRRLHPKHNRHHRVLTVRHSMGGHRRTDRVWLKFLPADRRRYDFHVDAWRGTREVSELLPRPYFYAEWEGEGVIGMECVDGSSLRGLFLRGALMRRKRSFVTVFEALGTGLRAFHGVREPTEFWAVDELEGRAARVTRESEHLTDPERELLLQRIAAASARARDGTERLPLVPVHHDPSMRNVLVRADGSPCLLDIDSVDSERKSRWYDVAVFLINLESQIKYAPLSSPQAIGAAWSSFWRGYRGSGMPDGLSRSEVHALLYLIKVDYLLAGPWRPLYEVYKGRLGPRYLGLLKESMLEGAPLAIAA